MKHGFLLSLCFVLFAVQVFALDLFSLFRSKETWNKNPASFVIVHRKNGFVYTDDSRSAAYSVKRGDLFFGTLPVYEARVFWDDGKLSRVEISIFNKGDAESPLNQRDFELLVKRASDILDAGIGNGVSSPQERLANHMLSQSRRWSTASMLVQLQWALTKPYRGLNGYVPFSAEYLRVTFVRATGFSAKDNAALTGRGILVKPRSLSELRKRVEKSPKGDVFIPKIPMVDQGQKGYCSAATAERLLRYYGLLVDQHQVAQLAETSAKSGTTFEGFAAAIETIGRSFSLDRDFLSETERGGDFSKSASAADLEAYNRIAKKRGAAVIDWRDHSTLVGPNMYSINLTSIWMSMDSEILLEAKTAQKMKMKAFSRNIVKFIDSGVPLFWSCVVGLFPEVPDVGGMGVFGHMRLIIGYNLRTKEIIYSDSWGAGHDFKRMPIDMAWSMTMGLIALKPRN